MYDGEWSIHRQKTRGRKAAAGIPAHAFVIAAQNHDQVGNRAAGDRLGALVDEGALKAAAALLLTAPFTPMLFQGEEWAASSPFQYFTDHDPELGKAVSEGRRREFAAFGWNPDHVPDPQDPQAFDRSKLVWNELDEALPQSDARLVPGADSAAAPSFPFRRAGALRSTSTLMLEQSPSTATGSA